MRGIHSIWSPHSEFSRFVIFIWIILCVLILPNPVTSNSNEMKIGSWSRLFLSLQISHSFSFTWLWINLTLNHTEKWRREGIRQNDYVCLRELGSESVWRIETKQQLDIAWTIIISSIWIISDSCTRTQKTRPLCREDSCLISIL